MPIINRESLHFGTLKERPFVRVISVDSKGIFTIKLPEEVKARLGEREVTAKSREEVIEEFNRVMKEFEATGTKTSKVIVYKFQSSAYIFRNDRCILRTDAISFSQGLVLSLCGEVVTETEITLGDGKKRYEYERLESEIPQSLRFNGRVSNGGNKILNQLPWSAAREAWFARMGNSLEDFVLILNNGFGDPKNVDQAIEHGKFPLLLK